MREERDELGVEGLHLVSPVLLDGFSIGFRGIRVLLHVFGFLIKEGLVSKFDIWCKANYSY